MANPVMRYFDFAKFILYIIFKTDALRPKTREMINRDMEKQYGIVFAPQTLKKYLDLLLEMGFNLIHVKNQGRNPDVYYYELGFSQFRIYNMMLLLENTKCISRKETDEYLNFLSQYLSEGEFKSAREIDFFCRIRKTVNEECVENLARLFRACKDNLVVTFRVFDPDENNKRIYRHNGARYRFEPIAFIMNGCQIYIFGLADVENIHKKLLLRVDYLENVEVERDPISQDSIDARARVDRQFRNTFAMQCGKEIKVTLTFEQSCFREFRDVFGNDVKVKKISSNGNTSLYEATVTVKQSKGFYDWVLQSHGKMKITAPESEVENLARHTMELAEAYAGKQV